MAIKMVIPGGADGLKDLPKNCPGAVVVVGASGTAYQVDENGGINVSDPNDIDAFKRDGATDVLTPSE